MTEAMTGKSLISSLTCMTCHKEDESSIGPAYVDVARKYRRNPEAATAYLVNKIQKGGGGVWGETVMPANPNLKNDDAKKVVAYILSLGRRDAVETPSLPATGSVDPTVGKTLSDNGVFVLSGSFTDKGAEGVKPLTGNSAVTLRNPKMGMDQARNLVDFSTMSFGGMTLMMIPDKEASFAFQGIDLTDIASIQVLGGGQEPSKEGFVIEVRLDSPSGKKIGETKLMTYPGGPGGRAGGMVNIAIEPITDGKKHDIYFVTRPAAAGEPTAILVSAEFKAK